MAAAERDVFDEVNDAAKHSVEQVQEINALARDPVTGKLDLNCIQGMTSKQLSRLSPGARAQLDHLKRLVRDRPDTSTFDYQSLVVLPDTEWTLELLYAGHVDANGKLISIDYQTGKATPGARAKYSYRCYDRGASYLGLVSLGKYRQILRDPDELTAAKLIRFLRRLFAFPISNATPILPQCIFLSLEVEVELLLEQGLRTFLDSLPAPFTWRVETVIERVLRYITSAELKKIELDHTLQHVNAFKEQGNGAFRKNDRKKAIEMYTKAIMTNWGMEDLFMGMFSGQGEERKKSLAVCYTNRAAAHLLPGDGLDPDRAIKDAEEAEKQDPTFKKAYIRQVRGYTILCETAKAKEVLDRGLKQKTLAQDSDLLEALALLQLDALQLDSKMEFWEGNSRRH